MPITEDDILRNARIMCQHYYFDYYKSYRPIGIKNFENRYFKFFYNASMMFCNRDDFNPEIFISSVMAEGFLYPTQIPVEKNWKIFQRNESEFRPKTKKSKDYEDAKKVAEFFTWLNGRSIKTILENPFTRLDIVNNDSLDLCVLCFSKIFKKFSESEEYPFIIDFKKERSKITNVKLLKKIKEKLGDDFDKA